MIPVFAAIVLLAALLCAWALADHDTYRPAHRRPRNEFNEESK